METPAAAFDPTRFGGQLNYILINPVPGESDQSDQQHVCAGAGDFDAAATATDNDGTVVGGVLLQRVEAG